MTTAYDYDLVCIGSGPAGQRAAVQAAKLGRRAAVIEKARFVGGACIDTGTIPSKTLREAIITYSGIAGRTDRILGTRVDGRPTADARLSGVASVMAREIEVVEHQLRRNDVTLITGEATFVDPHTLVVRAGTGWQHVTAEHIVIAVGTRPAPTPGVEADGEVILNSDSMVRLKRLPRTLAVVGAGVIGIEYASMLAAVGVQVTLVERRERPLEFVDREIVEELVHQLRDRNVTFRFGEAVESLAVSPDGPRKAVLHLESGKRIVADAVLFRPGDWRRRPRPPPRRAPRFRAAGSPSIELPHGRLPHLAAGDVLGYPTGRRLPGAGPPGRLPPWRPAGPWRRTPPGHLHPGVPMVGARARAHGTEGALRAGRSRYRGIALGQNLGNHGGLLRCSSTARPAAARHPLQGHGRHRQVHVEQAVQALGGGLDYSCRRYSTTPPSPSAQGNPLDASNNLRLTRRPSPSRVTPDLAASRLVPRIGPLGTPTGIEMLAERLPRGFETDEAGGRVEPGSAARYLMPLAGGRDHAGRRRRDRPPQPPSGFRWVTPENRLKSVSAETTGQPYSSASAARCASDVRLPAVPGPGARC